jgi:hypothetical protein
MVIDGPDGPLSAIEVPWGEQVTVPLHQPGAKVRTGLGAPDGVARVAALAAPAAALTAPLMRAAAPLLSRLVERMEEGPDAETRGMAESLVVAVAHAGGMSARVAVRCRDVYGLTARFLVEAALQVEGKGAQATAEALPARAFLDAVSGRDANGELSWAVL